MNKRTLVLLMAAVTSVYSMAASGEVTVTHRQFQAVNEDGKSAFSSSTYVTVEGILLNSPEEWLNPTQNSNMLNMGGEWEIFIQGEGDDHAGTACWMGQNYGSLAWIQPDKSYSDQEWLTELNRLNRDPNTLYVFRAGDRVRVTGRHLFYNGKRNINENHNNDPAYDFKVELLKPAVGLPQPIEITLADLRDENNIDIFDPNRLEGGEFYQSRRVRIKNVFIANPENWAPGNTITISDGQGLTFPVRLGIGDGISRYECPLGWIDVIGIVNQNGLINGYYLMSLNYDGSGLVLGEAGNRRGNLPGDINGDFKVDLLDFAELAANWITERAGLYPVENME